MHQRTCSVCKGTISEVHSWGNGTVTKQPSCKESGIKTYTCAGCGETKAEEITKTNNHQYGKWILTSESEHKRTCSICDKTEISAHSWDAGIVTKQPTCKEAGIKTYTCSVCGGTKTEEIAKTDNHKYGSWGSVDDAKHSHTCSVCGKIESSDHDWNSGTVTKQPSCKEDGIRTYACSVCGGTKTEDIAKTNDHQYENWTGVNDAEHKRICSVCNYADISAHTWDSGTITKKPTCKESGVRQYTCTVCGSTGTEQIEMLSTHTYDHECDTDCNVCGALRTVKHKNNTVWSSNKEGHWHACSECGDKSDFEPHTPGEAATESIPQICTKCGYIIQAALGHNHSFEDTWSTDMDSHWYACVGCGELDSYAAHSFDNLCDTNCNVCGYMRTTAHSFDDTWLNNADNHWHECANCGETDSVAPHTPGPVATTSAPQTCTVCGYELAPRVEEETEPAVIPEESTVKEEKPSPTEIVEDMEKTPVREFNFIRWILIWLACATVALVIILKKR